MKTLRLTPAPAGRHLCRKARQRNPSSVRSGIFRPAGAGKFYPVTILQSGRTYGAAAGERFSFRRLHPASLRLCVFALNRLVDGILAAKRTGDAATVTALETEIDAHVFRLYALTPAEIDLVKGTK